ncbi:hypothetical protein QJS10_CPB11g01891 [Acorus calamus]|uniref:Uncharacterized protein n=1 Tax=Acorus calamus TaxID=4465 RepID=A0AAV9DPP3_ACOCL|nr:hypothetical protein QJS10_CPB11g01891 [Acorus calamus]
MTLTSTGQQEHRQKMTLTSVAKQEHWKKDLRELNTLVSGSPAATDEATVNEKITDTKVADLGSGRD